MTKFIRKLMMLQLILILIATGIVLFSFFVIGSQYKYSYQASLVDKVNRLESIDEPKIILVGNSNLSFGIKSKMIEDEIGMPVVNLGLHGGLGNAYHEQVAKLNISNGDIVIVCHSSYYDDDTITDAELAWMTYDYNRELWTIFRKKDYMNMLTSYPSYLRKSIYLWLLGKGNQTVESCYSRTAFNEYGDLVYKPEVEQIDVDSFLKSKQNKILVPQINNICINRLNELNQYCNEQGATMVIAGYPIAYGKYSDFSENDFREFQESLENALDCEVISDYTDYFYPYEYFFNSILHLNDKGAEVRTGQLIIDLKNWKKTIFKPK